MTQNNKNLKNHQLLEISGVEIFKAIEKKKIVKESMDKLLKDQKTPDKK